MFNLTITLKEKDDTTTSTVSYNRAPQLILAIAQVLNNPNLEKVEVTIKK